MNGACEPYSEFAYPADKFRGTTVVVDQKSYIDKNLIVIPKQYSPYIDKVVLSKGLIFDRVEKLAQEIVRDYSDKHVMLLVVMKGAVLFGTVLADKITEILSNDITNSCSMTFSVEYISVKSYIDDKSTGDVKIKMDEKYLGILKNQNVLIVEDIYDSGQSLFALTNFLNLNVQPSSLKSTVLIQKMNTHHLRYDYNIEYLGFLIPDSFVVGFGMDYNEEFRQLMHLCVINQVGIDKFKNQK
jgi:hypoxanthine phosphoribosyltransferase